MLNVVGLLGMIGVVVAKLDPSAQRPRGHHVRRRQCPQIIGEVAPCGQYPSGWEYRRDGSWCRLSFCGLHCQVLMVIFLDAAFAT